MTLYTRPQLVVLLIVVLVAGTGLAVGHWRRTHPETAARLESLDRTGESSPAGSGDVRLDPDPSPRAASSSLHSDTASPAADDTEGGSQGVIRPGTTAAVPTAIGASTAAPRSRSASASEDPSAWRRTPPKETRAQPLDINRATEDELRTLPGIGSVLAGRIVQAREREGPFASLEDLRRVPGLGRAKLDRIAAAVTLPR